jgi:hypothetical protein
MIMPITADQVATLRAYLTGDFDAYDQLRARLDSTAARAGYSALIAAAFFKAVDQRFAKSDADAEVVLFVGSVRARSEGLGDKIDPGVAERLIRAVYTDEEIDDLDGETVLGTELLLLAALIVDEQFDDSELDEFLSAARKLADR